MNKIILRFLVFSVLLQITWLVCVKLNFSVKINLFTLGFFIYAIFILYAIFNLRKLTANVRHKTLNIIGLINCLPTILIILFGYSYFFNHRNYETPIEVENINLYDKNGDEIDMNADSLRIKIDSNGVIKIKIDK